MKISDNAIKQFKSICRNEESTSDDIVRFKIERDFLLGTHLETHKDNTYVVAFGTLRIKMVDDTITEVYRGKKNFSANKYAKYKYNYLYGIA